MSSWIKPINGEIQTLNLQNQWKGEPTKIVNCIVVRLIERLSSWLLYWKCYDVLSMSSLSWSEDRVMSKNQR